MARLTERSRTDFLTERKLRNSTDPGLIGFKEFYPGVSQNSVRDAKCLGGGGFPSHKNTTFLAKRKTILTLPPWEKDSYQAATNRKEQEREWIGDCRVRTGTGKGEGLGCQDLQTFSKLSHKRYFFRGKNIDHKMCVLIFFTTFVETFLILGRTERDTIQNAYWSPCTVPAILVGF